MEGRGLADAKKQIDEHYVQVRWSGSIPAFYPPNMIPLNISPMVPAWLLFFSTLFESQVILKNWAVFLPATIFNLAFLPSELRVLFLNVVFFFWTIFLSLTVNYYQQATPTIS